MANSQSQPGQNGQPRLCDSRSTMERAPRHGQGCVASRESKEQNSPFWSPRAGLSTVLESQDRKTLILNRSTTDRPRPAPPMSSSPSQLIQLQSFRCMGQKAPIPLDPSFSHTANLPSGHPVSAPCTRIPESDHSPLQYPWQGPGHCYLSLGRHLPISLLLSLTFWSLLNTAAEGWC